MIQALGNACIDHMHVPVHYAIRWQPPGSAETGDFPLLALVGKGVTFDSGGLDIKPASGMRLMKKDMGGAALMLALAQLIMGVGRKKERHPRGLKQATLRRGIGQ